MPNNSNQQSATIIAFPIRYRAVAAVQPAQQEIDWEERRWQLEWERRNVQD
jgi:hypothetical protein